jgi:hypothetical protein
MAKLRVGQPGTLGFLADRGETFLSSPQRPDVPMCALSLQSSENRELFSGIDAMGT